MDQGLIRERLLQSQDWSNHTVKVPIRWERPGWQVWEEEELSLWQAVPRRLGHGLPLQISVLRKGWGLWECGDPGWVWISCCCTFWPAAPCRVFIFLSDALSLALFSRSMWSGSCLEICPPEMTDSMFSSPVSCLNHSSPPKCEWTVQFLRRLSGRGTARQDPHDGLSQLVLCTLPLPSWSLLLPDSSRIWPLNSSNSRHSQKSEARLPFCALCLFRSFWGLKHTSL